jgi:hypothetical protein
MRQPVRKMLTTLVGAAALCVAIAPARAGVMDFLFGSADKTTQSTGTDVRRRTWTLREFTAIRLVPRESGAAPNQHPAQVDPEVLRQQLAQLRFDVGSGTQTLFAADEVGELAGPLAEALSNAGPEDDLLLLSSSRRGGGLFSQPLAVTARLFIQEGQLQLLVNDARYEFFNEYKGSGRPPQFTFGSRAKAGTASLRSAAGSSQRPDWVALPLAAAAAPAATARPMPAPAAAPAPAAGARIATPAAPASPAAAAPALRPRDPGFADEVEQRLLTLKRLRERGLISEEEYQQKRRDILQSL